MSMPLTPLSGGVLLPYECHEGNYAVKNALSAERAEDKAIADDLAKGITRPRRAVQEAASAPVAIAAASLELRTGRLAEADVVARGLGLKASNADWRRSMHESNDSMSGGRQLRRSSLRRADRRLERRERRRRRW